MKTDKIKPINQLRLYLCALVTTPLFTGLMVVTMALGMFYIRREQMRVVQIPADEKQAWNQLTDLPGVPLQIAATSDGSVWVTTQLKHTLSRYQDGNWDVFNSDTLGTALGKPEHKFVAVDDKVWAAFRSHLVQFEGGKWEKYEIPNAADDHVVAANEHTTWLLGNDGILRSWVDGAWTESEDLKPHVPIAAWGADERHRAPDLLVSDDGSLWLCTDQLWRRSQGDWTQVTFDDQVLENVELIGYAGKRIWLRNSLGVLWIDEDGKNHGRFNETRLGLNADQRIISVQQVGDLVCASGHQGISVLKGDRWELKWPMPDGIVACEEVTVAGDQTSAVMMGPVRMAPLWAGVPLVALFSGIWLLAMRWFLKPSYPLLNGLTKKHVMLLVLASIPMVLGIVPQASNEALLLAAPLVLAVFFLVVPPIWSVLLIFSERIQRTVEIMRLQPVMFSEMPVAARDYFETSTAEVEALGFRQLGDFRLKQRTEHFSRFFMNAEGSIVGAITWLGVSPWNSIHCFSCLSVTGDSTYLETGNIAVPSVKDDDHFVLRGVSEATIADTLKAHRHALEGLINSRNTHALRMLDCDLAKVVTYGQKLLYADMQRHRQIAANPYDDEPFDWSNNEPAVELLETS